jgi:hypothetical protein
MSSLWSVLPIMKLKMEGQNGRGKEEQVPICIFLPTPRQSLHSGQTTWKGPQEEGLSVRPPSNFILLDETNPKPFLAITLYLSCPPHPSRCNPAFLIKITLCSLLTLCGSFAAPGANPNLGPCAQEPRNIWTTPWVPITFWCGTC